MNQEQTFPMRREIRLVIPAERAGTAVLDFLTDRFTYHTRSEWQVRLAEGRMTVNHAHASPAQLLAAGDELVYDATGIPEPPMDDRISLVHCDEELVVVNKPGNLTCHPGGRYFNHTLWALLKTRHDVADPIFVNRIDRETSGLVVVARTAQAARNLRAQFAERSVTKRYLALVEGCFPSTCTAAGWIVPDFTGEVLKKRRFILVAKDGTAWPDPPAVAPRPHPEAQWSMTELRLQKVCGPISLIEAWLHTGRLHQIRVTLQTLGFPLVGDKLYGVDPGIFLRFCRDELTPADLTSMRLWRQALHAAGLQFRHPRTQNKLVFDLPLPEEMQAVIHAQEEATSESLAACRT